MYRSSNFIFFFFPFLSCFQPWFSLEPCMLFIVLRSLFSLACILLQFFRPCTSHVFRVWWKMVCAFPCAQLVSHSPSTGLYSLILPPFMFPVQSLSLFLPVARVSVKSDERQQLKLPLQQSLGVLVFPWISAEVSSSPSFLASEELRSFRSSRIVFS